MAELEKDKIRPQSLPEGSVTPGSGEFTDTVDLEKGFIDLMNKAEGNDNFMNETYNEEPIDPTSGIFQFPQFRDIDHIDAVEKIELELDGLNRDELDEWASVFVQVGKDYLVPPVFDEAKILVESRLGMSMEDWLVMKHQGSSNG